LHSDKNKEALNNSVSYFTHEILNLACSLDLAWFSIR